MKKELRLKDLLTVDPTDGSYVYDPLDIMITAYKKRKRDWMISETDPECECEEEDCECDCECHNIEESVYDTMSKYELGAELRRINKEIETNRIIMYSSSAADMIAFNDLDITLRKALEYIPNANPDKFVVDWIDSIESIDNILDTRICDMKLMQGTITN